MVFYSSFDRCFSPEASWSCSRQHNSLQSVNVSAKRSDFRPGL